MKVTFGLNIHPIYKTFMAFILACMLLAWTTVSASPTCTVEEIQANMKRNIHGNIAVDPLIKDAVSSLDKQLYLDAISKSEDILELSDINGSTQARLHSYIAEAHYALGNIELAIESYKTAASKLIPMHGNFYNFSKMAKSLEDTGKSDTLQYAPKPLMRKTPMIPFAFMDINESGYCTIKYDITKKGKTTNRETVFCSHTLLEKPSLKAVKKWKYHPRLVEGKSIGRDEYFSTVYYSMSNACGNALPLPANLD